MDKMISLPSLPISMDIPDADGFWEDAVKLYDETEESSLKGGPGSGNFGHAGRPGQQGGSQPAGVERFENGKPYISAKASDFEVGKQPEYGAKQASGAPIRGIPISPDDPRIGDDVYHMTTNMEAVKNTGALLARGVGGLGGDNRDQIVSMTTNKDTADQLSRDMTFAVELSREFDNTQPKYMSMEERQAGKRNIDEWQKWGLPLVKKMIEHSREEGWDFGEHLAVPLDKVGSTEYHIKDWLTQYFNARGSLNYNGHFGKNWKRNPIIFTDSKTLAKYDPRNIGVITIPRKNLKTGALLTNFDLNDPNAPYPSGLDEVRLYGDVVLDGASFATVKEYDSAIVAFDFNGFDLQKWSDDPVKDPHITLLFLGDTNDLMSREEVENQLRIFAQAHEPIKGNFTGFAIFNATPASGGKYPMVALFDSPELPDFQHDLAAVFDGQIEEAKHGFIPHMTIAYQGSNEPNYPDTPLSESMTIPSISLFWGDDRVSFPLGVEKGGPGSGNFGHHGRPGKQGGSQTQGVSMGKGNVRDWVLKNPDLHGDEEFSVLEKEMMGNLSEVNSLIKGISIVSSSDAEIERDEKKRERIRELYARNEAIQAEFKGFEDHNFEIMSERLKAKNPYTGKIVFGSAKQYRRVPDEGEADKIQARLSKVFACVEDPDKILPRKVNIRFMNIGGASWYDDQKDQIHIGIDMAIPTEESVSTHEFGHWLEEHSPHVSIATDAMFDKRSEQASEEDMKQARMDGYFNEDSMLGIKSVRGGWDQMKDHFVDPYMGRVYPLRHDFDYNQTTRPTEILSSSLEILFSNPKLLAAGDPEMFDLVISALSKR